MDSLLDRFCRYVRLDTRADPQSDTYPSSPNQLVFNQRLATELKELGLTDVTLSDKGILVATLPDPTAPNAPAIVWTAHVDTSPETTAENVQPIVHRDYDGGDIPLPGSDLVLRVSENPELETYRGKTLITTDGTTLLGSDDKSGVAVIVETARRMIEDRSLPRGPIVLCFTCDEEIGHGVDHVDVDALGAVAGYTLDGPGVGQIDCETFSANHAKVTVRGVNSHPSEGKGVMVNAIRIASAFLSRLPWQTMAPETTEGREGFLHPYSIQGGVAETTIEIILRDFETEALETQRQLLESTAEALRAEHPKATIEIEVVDQYRNMREGLRGDSRVVEFAERAMRESGLSPKRTIIRGGTDGSALTAKGLPTPNLSTGEHNVHTPLEWTCLEEMEQAVEVLIALARIWSEA